MAADTWKGRTKSAAYLFLTGFENRYQLCLHWLEPRGSNVTWCLLDTQAWNHSLLKTIPRLSESSRWQKAAPWVAKRPPRKQTSLFQLLKACVENPTGATTFRLPPGPGKSMGCRDAGWRQLPTGHWSINAAFSCNYWTSLLPRCFWDWQTGGLAPSLPGAGFLSLRSAYFLSLCIILFLREWKSFELSVFLK